jgi:hypothetical protein
MTFNLSLPIGSTAALLRARASYKGDLVIVQPEVDIALISCAHLFRELD